MAAESWNIERSEDPSGDYILLNRTRTVFRLSRRAPAHADIVKLMDRMEELGFPFSFTEGVKEVYFTVLSRIHGDYSSDRIRVSYDISSREILDRILIHELAHHVDSEEGISDREEILAEKKLKARYLPDTDARKNVLEYVAIGFEVYYCGTPTERRRMRRCNPCLYGTIRRLHRKHRAP